MTVPLPRVVVHAERVHALWKAGLDTLSIAREIGADESLIYNILAVRPVRKK